MKSEEKRGEAREERGGRGGDSKGQGAGMILLHAAQAYHIAGTSQAQSTGIGSARTWDFDVVVECT